jgi:hypothetical protein
MESRLDVGFTVYVGYWYLPVMYCTLVWVILMMDFCLPFSSFSIVSSVSDPLSFHTDPDPGKKSHKEVKKQEVIRKSKNLEINVFPIFFLKLEVHGFGSGDILITTVRIREA